MLMKPISLLQISRVGVIVYDWLNIAWLKNYYNFGFDHFNMEWRKTGILGLIDLLLGNSGPFATGDWILPDLTIEGTIKLNSTLRTFPNTYYFSYATKMTSKVFQNEDSCHNFHLSKSGRIWIKWDSSLVQFKPTHITTQMISGELHKGDDFICTLSVIYASNSQSDRFKLWDSLREVGSSISSPWVLLGDFNCCCHPSEKSGGSTLLQSQLWDFKSLIFDLGLMDLASMGLKYTWFNQRATDPIHLKLDRMLINDKWLEHYPNSYYEVHPPNCSDHSPIILLPGNPNKKHHRFLFKNFWTKQDSFWNELLNIFAQPVNGNPILGLYGKLKYLKCVIKGLPISLKKLNMADVKPLILNISEKLAGWKARLLSLAGRFQFLKYTVWNTIAYWIRGAVLPKACFKIINSSYLNAIYGSPWTPILHKASPYWKDVKKVASQISSNVLFYFNSHSKLAMLWDPWIDGKSLSMVCLDRNILSYFPHNAKVAEFLDGGTWNLPGLGGNALARFLGSIAYDTDATFNITWKDKSKATLSTFINQFFCEDSVLEWYKLVWHKHHALKYSIYTWIALNNGLKTADELIKRNIVVNNVCPLGYSQSESVNHILFECDYSFTVLSKLIHYLGEFLLRPRLLQLDFVFHLEIAAGFVLAGLSMVTGCLTVPRSVFSGVLLMSGPGWSILATRHILSCLSPFMDFFHGSSLCSTPGLNCWFGRIRLGVWTVLPWSSSSLFCVFLFCFCRLLMVDFQDWLSDCGQVADG
ncbi:hypothetical protein M5K25_015779 [Dendrobium thyrsiflorum]|uniref:Reverse transcriptase zinc-binding domain-containing protein n=1 Tax=Dendrobium thyrsiflorum TaxID=117978 RepID=A0ABD0UYA5_DENTH